MTWLSDGAVRHLRQMAVWPDFTGTKYRVVEELGRGGMGTVYLGEDAELGREVALKIANTSGAHPELEGRMRMEARVLARLEHPGIVPIHDAGRLPDGRPFYVMKYVRGETLTRWLRTPRSRDDVLRLFERIVEPVAFAHARNYVHRDLKPANVMVGSFGEVLVMDWGVAKVLGSGDRRSTAAPTSSPDAGHTDPGTVLGTPGYMPPEQAAGEVEAVDRRADVYALGAILFRMLTGSEPPKTPDGIRTALERRRLPKRLRAIMLQATAAEQEARYEAAAALARDVANFRSGRPVAAYPETPVDRALRFTSTYRTPILLVLAYLVMRAAVAWWFR